MASSTCFSLPNSWSSSLWLLPAASAYPCMPMGSILRREWAWSHGSVVLAPSDLVGPEALHGQHCRFLLLEVRPDGSPWEHEFLLVTIQLLEDQGHLVDTLVRAEEARCRSQCEVVENRFPDTSRRTRPSPRRPSEARGPTGATQNRGSQSGTRPRTPIPSTVGYWYEGLLK